MFEPGIHPAVTRLVPTKESTNISDILNSFAFPPVPASHFKPSTVLAMDSAAAAVPSEGHSSRIRRPVFGHPRQPRQALKTLSRPGVDRRQVWRPHPAGRRRRPTPSQPPKSWSARTARLPQTGLSALTA